ncbi:MAG: YkvA family protein [Pseudomonadota bacterium]
MSENAQYQQAFTENRFWQKLRRYATTAGREVVEKALLLFYAAQEEQAPRWAKATIAGALGYFIIPIDAIADLTPGVGYADDLGVLVLAIAAVASYINDDVREKANAKMRAWFGESPSRAGKTALELES